MVDDVDLTDDIVLDEDIVEGDAAYAAYLEDDVAADYIHVTDDMDFDWDYSLCEAESCFYYPYSLDMNLSPCFSVSHHKDYCCYY